MTKKTAALIGFDNPHSGGWLTSLKHSNHFNRIVACALEGEEPDADAVYEKPARLLKEESPAMAIVCTRNDRAPSVAAQVIRAGIPTIIEKPVARTAREIKRLVKLAGERKVVVATAFQNRFHPLAVESARLVREGALGRIVSIEANMVTSTVGQRNPRHWLFDESLSGGGILHWLACHTFDLIRYITGLEYTEVMAKVGTLSGEKISVEDVAAVIFELSNGALGNLHAGYMLRSRYGDILLKIRGTLGEIEWPMFSLDGRLDTLYVRSDAKGWETTKMRNITAPHREDPPGYGGSMSHALFQNVLDAASGKSELVVSCQDAYKSMQVIQAAYKSSAEKRAIKIRD